MQPITELDTRFSEPGAEPTPWAQTRETIARAQLFWLCTVRPDGQPHVAPLVAVWFEDALYFSTGPDEQKAHNLAANPQVALTTGTDDWDTGLDVVVEGRALEVTDRSLLSRLVDAWTAKWDGRWNYRVGDGGFEHENGGLALVYETRPTKVLVFAKGSFSQTRHLFSTGSRPARRAETIRPA